MAKINGGSVEMKIPLEDWVREVAQEGGRRGAREVMAEFAKTREATCPQARRISKLWIYLVALAGLLTGLGILNGWTAFVR